MAENKFKNTLTEILKQDSRLINQENELNQNLIKEYADKLDEQFIELLLNNEETRNKFFLKIKDVYVFKQNDFKFFLDENKIDNSYTQYENRIGLKFGSKLLKDTTDVVLNFPYKDCVLEGGQSTEEGFDEYYEFEEADEKKGIEEGYKLKQTKRKEIFFNEILAKDEIDRLFEPKAFTNIKKITAKGEEKVTNFARDENGTIKDNLIIKGNNLLALHSLKKEFAGRIKFIYIDPPYNTSSDSFVYNDKFNHSTWLTFMKNRLEVAKELLRDDGVIFISCDHNEQSYLKVLIDGDKNKLFGRENYIATLAVENNPKGRKNSNYVSISNDLSYLCKEYR